LIETKEMAKKEMCYNRLTEDAKLKITKTFISTSVYHCFFGHILQKHPNLFCARLKQPNYDLAKKKEIRS